MYKQVDQTQAQALLKGITIPPQPEALLAVRAEQAKPEPDLKRIAEIISADVGLAAGVLKAVNSPFFGFARKIGSIGHATSMLGLSNVANIVSGLALRANMKNAAGVSLERFWDAATDTARMTAYLAVRISGISPDQAYTLGLFHECGIPLMLQKYPDYKEVLKVANMSGDLSFTDVEEERYQTNHAVIGYLMARHWNLPETLSDAILNHHDPLVFENLGGDHERTVATLVALVRMGGHFADEIHERHELNDWYHLREAVLRHFDLMESEYPELKEEVFEDFRNEV